MNPKKYLDEAEEDKKRYIEELKIYQQSEQYQAFMKRQNAKKIKTIVGKPHLTNVWENSKNLWKHSPAASVPTAFLVLPNFHSCFYNSIETPYMFSIS